MSFSHEPVLVDEVLRYLAPRSGGVYLDGTVGGGGHAVRILEESAPDGILIGIDRDRDALGAATRRLAPYGGRVRLFHGRFDQMERFLDDAGIEAVDGILLDLGVSSHQLDTPERGFSFQGDGALDMRMDTTCGESAADLLMRLSEDELAELIWRYGEERMSRRIARAIVARRMEKPIERTSDLAKIVRGVIPTRFREDRIDPATRTFQALRIAVNNELETLEKGLSAALRRLGEGGRIVVISFHSLEDRIVKEALRRETGLCRCPRELPRCSCGARATLRILTRRPVMATDEEISRNRRARSAKLRAAEKMA
jgi:16S rRNA (cytosine1402-N4)-methyltransferase